MAVEMMISAVFLKGRGHPIDLRPDAADLQDSAFRRW
jgi:hypothetical protein